MSKYCPSLILESSPSLVQRDQSICHMTGGDRTEQPVPERRILQTKMESSYLLSCYNKRQGVKMILGISST